MKFIQDILENPALLVMVILTIGVILPMVGQTRLVSKICGLRISRQHVSTPPECLAFLIRTWRLFLTLCPIAGMILFTLLE